MQICQICFDDMKLVTTNEKNKEGIKFVCECGYEDTTWELFDKEVKK